MTPYISPLTRRQQQRRRTSPKQWACRLVLVLCGVAIGLQISQAIKPDAQKLAESQQVLNEFKQLNTELAKCLPDDIGVTSILNLDDIDGYLKLHCEKRARTSFSKSAAAVTLAIEVPVSVE